MAVINSNMLSQNSPDVHTMPNRHEFRGNQMNTVAALEYLQQLFETVLDVDADQKSSALEKAKKSIGLFREHDNLLTVDTVNLLKEVSLKDPRIFSELPIHVAKGIIRIHAIGPDLSLQKILKAVGICIVSTTYRPSESLDEFIRKLQDLRDLDLDLITNDNRNCSYPYDAARQWA